jgi:hypothetical protein
MERAGAGRSPRRRRQTQAVRSNVFLVGLFLAGAAGVYGLSLRKGPAPALASAEQRLVEQQVDSAILRLSRDPKTVTSAPAAGRVTRELLRNFYEQAVQRQVPLKKLRKNPFFYVRAAAVVTGPTTSPAPEGPSLPPGGGGSASIQAALAALRLQSVIMGRGGEGSAAIISNNLLTVGQSIEGFLLKSIGPESVVLTREGKDYELRMP